MSADAQCPWCKTSVHEGLAGKAAALERHMEECPLAPRPDRFLAPARA